MKRIEHCDERGVLVGIELTQRDTRDVSRAIEVQSAPPALIRIAVGGRPAVWARVWDDRCAWTWIGARESPERDWPRVLASTARTAARRGPGSDAWLTFWIDAWWDALKRATARTRGRIDVVPLRDEVPRSYRYLVASRRLATARAQDVPQMWSPTVLPLRPWPTQDDARVKAHRKLARDGLLPPIVLRWVSGLMAHVVVDGHARLIAAALERALPHVLAIVPVYAHDEARAPRWTERATTAVEALLASPDANTRSHAIDTLNRAAVDGVSREWRAIERARPVPGGASAWRAEVERALEPRGDRDLAFELAMPFERPTQFDFTW